MMNGVTLRKIRPFGRIFSCAIMKFMQRRTAFGLSIVILSIIVAGLHGLANMYYLYWVLWWFDLLMHFLGGLLVGLVTLWWLRFEIPISIRSKIPRFLTAFFAVLAVGVAWEVFEYVTGTYGVSNMDDYMFDTVTDVLMDIVGMLFAYFMFVRYEK